MNRVVLLKDNKIFLLILFALMPLISLAFLLTACGGGKGASNISTAGTAKLTWDAPTTNTNGAALTDLSGYKLYYGISSGNYTNTKDIGTASCTDVGGKTECTYIVEGLAPGSYYFAVTAYNSIHIESDYSNEVNKTVN